MENVDSLWLCVKKNIVFPRERARIVVRIGRRTIHSFTNPVFLPSETNPVKCKVLAVDFLHYDIVISAPPIATGGTIVEQIESFKFHGVYLSHDLTCTMHVDHMVKKANRRLYALSCGVPTEDVVRVYCSLVRPILEYACTVFAALPQYLSTPLRCDWEDTEARPQK